MKYNFLLVSILLTLTFSASSQNTHHHNDHTHSHDDHTHEELSFYESYTLIDSTYGTKTKMTVGEKFRTMVTNALPNHKTGTFPNQGNPNSISAQNRSYTFPLNPKYTGKAQWIREPGVALNGVKFEPGTAEVVLCDTGENYRVEALQDVIDLGLDFNHAHVQPTGAYHYHGTPTSLIEQNDLGEDLVHVGFAHDGFPMYYSKSGKYKPSFKLVNGDREGEDCTYENPHQSVDISVGGHHDGTYTSDFEYIEGSGDLDECNGITINGQYMYLVTDEFPYVSRCLMGEIQGSNERRPPRNEVTGRGPVRREGRPSLDQLLLRMDTNKDGKLSKEEVKGPLVNHFSKIDDDDDGYLTKEELKNAPKPKRQRPEGGQPRRR